MDRTWPFVQSTWRSAKTTSDVQSGLFATSSHDTVYTLFAPLHYEPGYSYPLIVWLHGHGNDERQLVRIMPLVSMRNYVAVAPRGTLIAAGGKSPSDCFGWQQSEEHVASSRAANLRQHRPGRAEAEYRAAAGFPGGIRFRRHDGLPRGHEPSKPVCRGHLAGRGVSDGRTPLAKLTEARRLPVFVAAGRHSTTYTAANVCADLRLLHAAGLSITLREYPCGHELPPQMLSDVDRWMMDQIQSAPAATAESDHQWLRETE